MLNNFLYIIGGVGTTFLTWAVIWSFLYNLKWRREHMRKKQEKLNDTP